MAINWPIVGHENIKEFLEKSLKAGRLHHAHLFCGPANVGKMTLAKVFIQSLLCEKSSQLSSKGGIDESLPCDECPSCKAFLQGIHPDVSIMDSIDGSIKIEPIRGFINDLSQSSLFGKTRVGLINNAHLLTEEAQNAMLKTLEESKNKKIIILISERTLLPTINSRVQKIIFHLVTDTAITAMLKEQGATHAKAMTLANLALGRPGVAFDLLRDEEQQKKYHSSARTFLSLFQRVDNFGTFAQVILGKDLNKARERFNEITKIGLRVLRDLLLFKLQLAGHVGYLPADEMNDFFTMVSPLRIVSLIKELNLSRSYVAANVDPRFVLENFYLSI